MSESIGRVMTRIVNTSACSEETEGYTCEQCNKYIAAITVEVPQLRIKNKILPTCECVVEREEEKYVKLKTLLRREK